MSRKRDNGVEIEHRTGRAEQVAVTQLEQLQAAARRLLVIQAPGKAPDNWLWERSLRVMRIARMLARLPEIGPEAPDDTVVAAAALFHDAGWAVQARDGSITPAQMLGRPTNDLQRELGAQALQEHAAGVLPVEAIEMASDAIRQCNDRYTALAAARVLSEATNLDDIGVLHVLRQFRQYQAEGRPLSQMVVSWTRQIEYDFWKARINECLQFETTRQLARQRLEAVERFVSALAVVLDASDLQHVLLEDGIELPPPLPALVDIVRDTSAPSRRVAERR